MQERHKHELDGYTVEQVPGEGWMCECADFEVLGACEHTETAAVLDDLARTHAESWARSHAQSPSRRDRAASYGT